MDGGLNILNEEMEKDAFVDFVGPLPSWVGLSTLVRLVPGNGLGGAGTWGDGTSFCGSWVAGGLP